VTGAASDPSTIVHVGRLTYRVEKPAANGNADATALASSGRAVLVNG
jgi:hypothetical protein